MGDFDDNPFDWRHQPGDSDLGGECVADAQGIESTGSVGECEGCVIARFDVVR